MKIEGCTCEHAPGLHVDTLRLRGCRLCQCQGVPVDRPSASPVSRATDVPEKADDAR